MKGSRRIVLVLLSILIVGISFLLQLNLSLNSTVLSEEYLNKTYDKSNAEALMTDILVNNTAVIKSGNEELIHAALSKYTDNTYLKQTVDTVAKGIIGYLTGSKQQLPVINIGPLKDGITKAAVDQASLEAKKLGLNIKAETIANKVIKEKRIDLIKVDLDVNDVMKNLSSSGENPIEGLRSIITFFKSTSGRELAIILFILIVIVGIINFNKSNIVKWQAVSLIISGLLSCIVGLTLNISGKINNGGYVPIQLRPWIDELINGVIKKLMLIGAAVIIISTIILVISTLVYRRAGSVLRETSFTSGQKSFTGSAVKIALCIFFAITAGFVTVQGYKDITGKVTAFKESTKNINVTKAVVKATNIQFLSFEIK